ncbi:radical SAM protein [Plantactinospora veratri]|uniref:Radical SAM protein n=2 Tax=Plantactinospora veratri TaxID=1436122 RepID=A0ABU7SBY6_9ACTN
MTSDSAMGRYEQAVPEPKRLVGRRALRFLLTDTCNLRCVFCHNEFQGDMGSRPRETWNWDRVRALLADAAVPNRPRVKISGGEPTLRWSTLLQLLRLSREVDARDLTLFSNLTLLSESRIDTLRDAGLDHVAANLPSFRSGIFASRTAQSRQPLNLVLENAALLRSAGISVQFNLVVPRLDDESAVKAFLTAELAAADAHSATWDTIALVADDWSPNPTEVQGWIRRWLGWERGLVERTDRPYRSHEFDWGGRRVLASRCTRWGREQERAEADDYVVAPGRILRAHVRGRAYRAAPGATDGQEPPGPASGGRVPM